MIVATPRTSFVNSKDSNGAAGRAVQAVEGLARTLRLDLLHRPNIAVGRDVSITSWMVTHAAWPISTKYLSRIHQFGKKVIPGIFLDYVSYARRIWKGDILVVDLEELEEMDASEINAFGLNAKEVILPSKGEENYKFSVADGILKTIWRRPGTENVDLDTESIGSRRKSSRFSCSIERVFTNHVFSRLTSGCQ